MLKRIALAAGVIFYCFALPAVIFISFARTVIESRRPIIDHQAASTTVGEDQTIYSPSLCRPGGSPLIQQTATRMQHKTTQ